jgi:hypothetical protein
MSYQSNYTESPDVSIDRTHFEEPMLVVHSHINEKGKMILNKKEAALLLIELYSFIKDDFED